MAKSVDIHLNDILRVHYKYQNPNNKGTKFYNPHEFSIDMLVVYYKGGFLLVNLETGMVYVEFPSINTHSGKRWTLNKLRLYINQNHKELLPIRSIDYLGKMATRL